MSEPTRPIDPEALLAEAGRLHAIARRLVADPNAADDLVQDTLLAAMQTPPGDPGRGLGGWLATVLHNRFRRSHRSDDRRRTREACAAREEAQESHAARVADVEARLVLQRRLAEAIASLPEPYRTAVTLRWIEGRAPAEVAHLVGTTPTVMRQRLHRATAMLRERLDGEYGDRSAWSVIVLALPSPGSAILSHANPPLAPVSLTTSFVGGVLTMSMTVKVLVALALVLALSLFTWTMTRPGAEPDVAGSLAPVNEPIDAPPSKAEPAIVPGVARAAVTANASTTDATDASSAEERLAGIALDPSGTALPGVKIEITRRERSEFEDLSTGMRPELHPAPRSIASLVTDASGRFAVPLPLGRAFDLRATRDGFAGVVLQNRFSGEDLVVSMTPAATLRGTVTRAPRGEPCVGAQVRGFRSPRAPMSGRGDVFVVKTDEFGRYSVGDLPTLDLVVECTPVDGALPMWERLHVEPGAAHTLDITIRDGFTVRGRVLDAESDAPIADAEVGAGWTIKRPVRTDREGRFVYAHFPTNGYRDVGVRASGYGGKTALVPKASPEGAERPELEIRLHRAVRVTGRVLDAAGAPIAGAYVAAVASVSGEQQQTDWQLAHTDAAGHYVVNGVNPTLPHVLVAQREGYGSVVYDFPVRTPGDGTLTLDDVRLSAGRLVRGTLVDGAGLPVPNHLVELKGANADHTAWWNASLPKEGAPAGSSPEGAYLYVGVRRARTDGQGRFAFADVAAGTYRVDVRAEGAFEPTTDTVIVQPDVDPAPLRIALDGGLSIRGRVETFRGKPIHRAWVTIARMDTGFSIAISTDEHGRFVVASLQPGLHRVSVRADRVVDGVRLAPTSVASVMAGTDDCLVILPEGRSVRGTAVESDGTPAAAATIVVVASNDPDAPFSVNADSKGRFEVDVPLGIACRVHAREPNAYLRDPPRRATPTIDIETSTNDVRLVFPKP